MENETARDCQEAIPSSFLPLATEKPPKNERNGYQQVETQRFLPIGLYQKQIPSLMLKLIAILVFTLSNQCHSSKPW